LVLTLLNEILSRERRVVLTYEETNNLSVTSCNVREKLDVL